MSDETKPDTPKVLDVSRPLPEWSGVIEDGDSCAACGDDFEVGEQTAWEPSFWYPDIEGAVEQAHAHCAVKNGFRLRYEGEEGWDGDR